MSDLAYRFYRLFQASPRSYGIYQVNHDAKPDDKGKIEGKRWTEHKEITQRHWEDHLDGKIGIGLVPIRPGGICSWGALDVDEYRIDVRLLPKLVAQARLPLVVVRSKSGGAHLYLFIRGSAPAKLVRKKLAEWAKYLGLPQGVEIFPKQENFSDDVTEEDDPKSCLGSWLNMPYQDNGIQRYAFAPDGSSMDAEEFLQLAEDIAVDPDYLEGIFPIQRQEAPSVSQTFDDAPEFTADAAIVEDPNDPYAPFRDTFACIVPILENGAHLANRDTSLWNMGLAAVIKYGPYGLEQKLAEWHRTFFHKNPLPDKDVAKIARSVVKKNYMPQCKQTPLRGHCAYGACMQRPFGVGAAGRRAGRTQAGAVEYSELQMGTFTRVMADPPYWRVEVNGVTIDFTSAELEGQRGFILKVMDATGLIMRPVKGDDWRETMGALTRNAPTLEVPEDATQKGQFMVWIERYCTSITSGEYDDMVSMGRPVLKDDRCFFQAADLLFFLRSNKLEGINERVLWDVLGKRDVRAERVEIKGTSLSVWSVKAFPIPQNDYAVPRHKEDTPF